MFLKRIVFCLMCAAGLTAFAATSLPGKRSEWNGCERRDFIFDNRQATVVVPDSAAEGRPWIWRPAFFDAFAEIDREMLREGFAIAYLNFQDEYASPAALAAGDHFYKYMTDTIGLSPKVIMEGLSRGGYYSLRFAEEHPERVACLILDNPLVDVYQINRIGKSAVYNSNEGWNNFLKNHGLEAPGPERGDFKDNAAFHLGRIADAGIPVLAMSGGADSIVPFEKNVAVVREVYRRRGRAVPFHSIVRPGGAHHPHGLPKPEAAVAYLKACADGSVNDKRLIRVACIGNSVTEGVGTTDPATRAYPAVLQRMLGAGYDVRNFGLSCSTVLKKGTDAGRPFAYINSDNCCRAKEFMPDVVIIKLGGNDGKPCNWQYGDEFEADYQALIDEFKYLPSLPEIFICLPVNSRIKDPQRIWTLDPTVVANEILPRIKHVAHENRIETIRLDDVYEGEEATTFSDNIHPTNHGNALIARRIYNTIAPLYTPVEQ